MNILGWFLAAVLSIVMASVITSQLYEIDPVVVTKVVEIKSDPVIKTVYQPQVVERDNFITVNIKQKMSRCNTGHGELWDLKYAAESNCGKNMWQKGKRKTITTKKGKKIKVWKGGYKSHRAENKLTCDGYAGHFQLGCVALKQIKCTTNKCKRDRFDFDKAIAQAKLLHKDAIRQVRSFDCLSKHPVYIEYLYHQQGPYGICSIIKASKGLGKLSKTVRSNMISNSTLTHSSTERMSHTTMSKMFLLEWRIKIANGGLKL